MQPESTLRGLAAVVRRSSAAHDLRANSRAFFERAGVEGADLDQMSGLPADRLLAYRRLVFNRFLDTIHMTLPRSVGRRGHETFKDDVSRFLDEAGSRSPYLRDIATEFVAWAAPVWSSDPAVPEYLPDLARHELLSFETASMPDETGPTYQHDLDLERGLVFQAACRVVRYDFAVHRLPADEGDRTEPEREATTLLAYRDRNHRVRFLELGPVAAAVVQELIDRKATLRQAVADGCTAAGVALDDAVLAGIAEFLADLSAREVLLGTEAR